MKISDYIASGKKTTGTSSDALVFLCAVLGRDRSYMFAHGDEKLPEDAARRLDEMMARRAEGEPAAYITGTREFMGMRLKVTPAVLIPRPETELLVEEAARLLNAAAAGAAQAGCRQEILEIGTGSGCIAIGLAKMCPTAAVTAVDISAAALAVAEENAAACGFADRIRFVRADAADASRMAEISPAKFDALVSNPPYIRSGDIAGLPDGVGRFEPATALDGGGDGLHFYRLLSGLAGEVLRPGGFAALEIGHGQGDAVSEIFLAGGQARKVSIKPDYAGLERIAVIDFG